MEQKEYRQSVWVDDRAESKLEFKLWFFQAENLFSSKITNGFNVTGLYTIYKNVFFLITAK